MKKKCDLLNSWWTICWNWLFSTYLWCVNIKQFVFTFQHHKFRHFIACRTSWMILATHSPPTLALPLLFLYSLPLLISRDVWLFYQRVAQGYRNEEDRLTPAPALPLPAVTWSRGWAELWLGDLACLGTAVFCCPAPVVSSPQSQSISAWWRLKGFCCGNGVQCECLPVCTVLPKWSEHLGICVSQGCSKGLLCLCLVLGPRAI